MWRTKWLEEINSRLGVVIKKKLSKADNGRDKLKENAQEIAASGYIVRARECVQIKKKQKRTKWANIN